MDQETQDRVPLFVVTEVDDDGFTHAYVQFGINITFKTKGEGRGISRSPHMALAYALEDLSKLVAKGG